MENTNLNNNKYENGKIYKIIDLAYTEQYFGSTIQPLCARMALHRSEYKKKLNDGISRCSSFILFDKYTPHGCKIELVEEFPCSSKSELLKREGYYIQSNNCVNKQVAGRTHNEYMEMNKERIANQRKQFREMNAERLKEQQKKYIEGRRDEILQRRRENRQLNPEKFREYDKNKYENNRDEILKRNKMYRDLNIERLRDDKRVYYHKNKEIILQRQLQTICCAICNKHIIRANMSRHQKSKYCKEIQNKNNNLEN